MVFPRTVGDEPKLSFEGVGLPRSREHWLNGSGRGGGRRGEVAGLFLAGFFGGWFFFVGFFGSWLFFAGFFGGWFFFAGFFGGGFFCARGFWGRAFFAWVFRAWLFGTGGRCGGSGGGFFSGDSLSGAGDEAAKQDCGEIGFQGHCGVHLILLSMGCRLVAEACAETRSQRGFSIGNRGRLLGIPGVFQLRENSNKCSI